MPNSALSYGRLSPRTEEYDSHRSPEAELIDMVAHLQLEIETLMFEQSAPSALAKKTRPTLSKPTAFTSTKVPKFNGDSSWDQYHQVFDAIVRSIGWDDATVALQLLSHLEGDACGPVGTWGETRHASRGSGGIDRTLWITWSVGRLSASVREDDSSGRRRPVDIRYRSRDTCSESVWGHGRERPTATYTGSVCRHCALCTTPTS